MVLIVLGGIISLLMAMLAQDALLHLEYPVATENWIPMVMLIVALGSLVAAIASA